MSSEAKPEFEIKTESKTHHVRLSGAWVSSAGLPSVDSLGEALEATGDPLNELRIDGGAISEWDSGLLVFLDGARRLATAAEAEYRLDASPKGVANLLRLAREVPAREAEAEPEQAGFFERIGERTLSAREGIDRYCSFLGQVVLDLGALCTGRAQVRRRDVVSILAATGPQALPIVSLLSFLTGLIIAFIGVIQLQKFAADIYVADLVGLAMTRELGAVMVGVIMAGRTGAAFAAKIGSMQVNEEVDALTSFGIAPMQFLVLPRLIAMVVMMPLLCVFADLVGILGGLAVAVAISDVTVIQYANQVMAAVDLSDFLGGVFKSAVFGVIIAFAGCYRGLRCGRDANAVGLAATSAVVTSITWIVVADAIFAVLFNILGI